MVDISNANEETQEQVLKYLQNTHLHICIPCFGGQTSEPTFMSMLRFAIMASKIGLNYSVDTISNESLIPRARNNLVSKMLFNKKATHLMFIDADIGFDPESIIRLILSNKDVVGGAYPMKKMPTTYVLNSLPNPKTVMDLTEVACLGTGFMLIRRNVLERMISAHPELKVNDNINFSPETEHLMYSLFDTMIDHKSNYLSEDWTFCYRWRLLGGECWIDTGIKLNHAGSYTYIGNTEELKKVTSGTTSKPSTFNLDLNDLSGIDISGC